MRLPPLNAVRVFEAAGRLENFSKAAAELGVTPGAVSRQMRNLEQHLGASLFARSGTDVRLTPEGRLYLASVQDALEILVAGTQRMTVSEGAQPLHIWGSRFFIRLWLVPRLQTFYRDVPGQEVMIESALPSDPMPAQFDVAIRVGDGAWPGYRADLLIQRVLVPVCSPSYLRANPDLKKPRDLERAVLIQTPLGVEDWTRWYAETGEAPVPLLHRMTFTSTDMAYSAALDGVGVVLGRRGFFENDVEKGTLVPLFEQEFRAEDGFYLVYKEREPLPRRIVRFREWLGAQLAAAT
jgi:LysR family glycine cleavage system transcriptional activator